MECRKDFGSFPRALEAGALGQSAEGPGRSISVDGAYSPKTSGSAIESLGPCDRPVQGCTVGAGVETQELRNHGGRTRGGVLSSGLPLVYFP